MCARCCIVYQRAGQPQLLATRAHPSQPASSWQLATKNQRHFSASSAITSEHSTSGWDSKNSQRHPAPRSATQRHRRSPSFRHAVVRCCEERVGKTLLPLLCALDSSKSVPCREFGAFALKPLSATGVRRLLGTLSSGAVKTVSANLLCPCSERWSRQNRCVELACGLDFSPRSTADRGAGTQLSGHSDCRVLTTGMETTTPMP